MFAGGSESLPPSGKTPQGGGEGWRGRWAGNLDPEFESLV